MILINGQPENRISVSDRGLQYGDGVFETMAYRHGRLEYLDAHLKRLLRGCERLGIPFAEPGLLKAELAALCAQTAEDSVIKLILTRGEGGRGYRAGSDITPTRIVAAYPLPVHPEQNQQGVTVRLCSHRLGHNPVLAGIKHLNRLEQVLARNEWQDEAVSEGLMLDIKDNLVEGTMSNLFLVKQGELLTAALSHCGIAGIMRDQVIGLANRHDIACRQQTLSLADLDEADEVFLTNSLIGIWPVTRVSEAGLSYRHGPVTQKLQQLLEKNIH